MPVCAEDDTFLRLDQHVPLVHRRLFWVNIRVSVVESQLHLEYLVVDYDAALKVSWRTFYARLGIFRLPGLTKAG